MNVLVTGGAGAIGARLVEHLIDAGEEVVVLDDLSSGYSEDLPPGADLVVGDVCDAALVSDLCGHVEAVIHLAALFANQNSVEHPVKDLRTNAEGTLNVLEGARLRDCKSVVVASSSCVYGRADQMREEANPGKLDTPYAISKLAAEYYCRYFAEQYALPVTLLRLFNSFGPGDRPGMYRSVIPNFIAASLRGESLVITGTGDETRDFTYVDDVVRAFRLTSDLTPSLDNRQGVFNIGTGIETSIIWLAETINRLTGNLAETEFVSRRGWDGVPKRKAETALATQVLGFTAQVPIEVGLRSTVEWLRARPELWASQAP